MTGPNNNHCLRADARATCSVMPSIGDGVQDIGYILRCAVPWDDGLWCDTYDGLNGAAVDWWAVHWSEPVWCNVLQFRQGPMTDGGGWWRSLGVEYQARPGAAWRPVSNLQISPPYDFSDRRGNRQPYERFTLVFDRVCGTGLRLTGQPGGLAQHTKIAQLAVYDHDLSFWVPPPAEPPPRPRPLELLPPGEIFRLLVRFYPVCDILFTLMIERLNLIYFLDEQEYAEWKSLSRFSADPTDFWRRVYDLQGAKCWYALTTRLVDAAKRDQQAVTGVREDGLAQIIAPLIVDGRVLGVLRNTSLVRVTPFAREQQRAYARSLQLDENLYLREIEKIPAVSRQKLAAIGAFLASIANTLRDLSLRGELLAHRRRSSKRGSQQRAETVRQAIQYMRAHLDEPLSVAGLAATSALSPAHFSRLFRQETGRSPKQYLLALRIERACFLLRSGRVSVAEACVAVGYSSITSFTRLFKQRMGLTPAEYARTTPR